jgi:hypothetical protein
VVLINVETDIILPCVYKPAINHSQMVAMVQGFSYDTYDQGLFLQDQASSGELKAKLFNVGTNIHFW